MQTQKSIFSSDSRIKAYIVLYLDLLIRSLISFLCIGVLFSLVFIKLFHWSVILVIILSILTAVVVSPFLARIKIAERIIDSYEDMLIRGLRK